MDGFLDIHEGNASRLVWYKEMRGDSVSEAANLEYSDERLFTVTSSSWYRLWCLYVGRCRVKTSYNMCTLLN